MAGTWKAFDDDNPALGAVLGLFSVGWYSGNIYGSVTTAHRRNVKQLEDHLVRFELGLRY